MPCTTILVGKKASYDGSTIIARNDDAGSANHFTAKKFVIVNPEDQPELYQSVLTNAKIPLPANPMRYSAAPNAVGDKGIWAACGVNEMNVGMTATETISTNERVQAADPLVSYDPEYSDVPGGIGEEDFVTLVLPYIKSAREGVERLGSLLETYGTNEMNGIAFSDSDEIWWMETIGGHHWMARRVPDNCYAVIPNQLGLDRLDLKDALGEQKEYMCSADLREFIEENHLDLTLGEVWTESGTRTEIRKDTGTGIEAETDTEAGIDTEAGSCTEAWTVTEAGTSVLNPREAFGSHDDSDHAYNTPRAWYMLRYFNPKTLVWDGPDADYRPEDDDLPWCMIPERKITTEDVKYILSSHYQGTPYDPYTSHGDKSLSNKYRAIGINRTDLLGIIQIRPYLPEECKVLHWISFGSNVFNASAPFYPNVSKTPSYLSSTTGRVSTDSWYWTSRLIAALADASWTQSRFEIEHYSFAIQSEARRVIHETDKKIKELVAAAGTTTYGTAAGTGMSGATSPGAEAGTTAPKSAVGTSVKIAASEDKTMDLQVQEILEQANQAIADILMKHADKTLDTVLQLTSDGMRNRFSRADM